MKPLLSVGQYLYQALGSPDGLAVPSTNRKLLQSKLLRAKVEAHDPELEGLEIILPTSHPDEVWIIHRTHNAAA